MVRHADVHNPTGVVYGRLPRFGLSEIGVRQAQDLAVFLAGLPIVAIYASPQLRARQTAGYLDQKVNCGSIHISELIAEVRTSYQGQPNTVISPKRNFYDHPAAPTDETISGIARRMSSFLSRVRHRHHGQLVVGVSHADPIMILRADTLGMPLVIGSIQGRYYPSKCSITQFTFVEDSSRPVLVYQTPVVDVTDQPKAPDSGKKAEAEPYEPPKPTPWLPH